MDMKPKNLLRRVFDFARSELERRSARPSSASLPFSGRSDAREHHGTEVRRPLPGEGGEPADAGLSVERIDATRLRVRWAFSSDDVERALPLIDPGAVLCLRLVSFATARESVTREVQDRPGLDLIGECDVQARGERLIIAFGLRSGERFVSLKHGSV